MPLSIRGAQWNVREDNPRLSLTLAQRFDLPEAVARILAQRGVALDQVETFLSPKLKTSLPDPFHLKDMDKAAARLARAIREGEKIAIFGDYDVDGATSSAIIKQFLRAVGSDALIYIPDRITEGYGPNSPAFQKLAKEKCTLCITVDCGALAFEPIALAKKLGMDTIVLDHHIGAEMLPDAFAVINPNRLDETSEYRYLAAVGVSFLTLVATRKILDESGWFSVRAKPDLMEYLDCVALGTVCDVMPLVGLNRAFVAQGLKILHTRKNLGLKHLIDRAGLSSPPSSYHLGFVIGPRINAGGRVGKSDLGATLLSSGDEEEILRIVEELERHNQERKTIEEQVQEEAFAHIDSAASMPTMIFAQGQGWHPGVIGIVAGRLKERYHRPAAAISIVDGVGKASVRSIEGLNMGNALAAAKAEGLLIAGGGHAMAAGFTVEEKQITALHNFLCDYFSEYAHLCGTPTLHIDAALTAAGVTLPLLEQLEALAPFGVGNAEPRFLIRNAYLHDIRPMKDAHLRMRILDSTLGTRGGGYLSAVCFRCLGEPLGEAILNSPGKRVHIVGKAQANHWQGATVPQFIVEDVSFE